MKTIMFYLKSILNLARTYAQIGDCILIDAPKKRYQESEHVGQTTEEILRIIKSAVDGLQKYLVSRFYRLDNLNDTFCVLLTINQPLSVDKHIFLINAKSLQIFITMVYYYEIFDRKLLSF